MYAIGAHVILPIDLIGDEIIVYFGTYISKYNINIKCKKKKCPISGSPNAFYHFIILLTFLKCIVITTANNDIIIIIDMIREIEYIVVDIQGFS